MFYLLLLSKLVLKFFGTIFDTIEKFFRKMCDIVKTNAKKWKFKKKSSDIQQEI